MAPPVCLHCQFGSPTVHHQKLAPLIHTKKQEKLGRRNLHGHDLSSSPTFLLFVVSSSLAAFCIICGQTAKLMKISSLLVTYMSTSNRHVLLNPQSRSTGWRLRSRQSSWSKPSQQLADLYT